MLRLKRRVHHLEEPVGELAQRGLDAGADVENGVSHLRRHCQHVGTRHVAHVHEVHRLRAVAEDRWRTPALDGIHPANHHFGVGAVDVHPRPVHVEGPKRDVVEVVHVVEAAEQRLIEQLCCAVERAVVVRVMRLPRGKLFGQSVHRRRRSRHHFRDALLDRGFKDIEGPVDEDVLGHPRVVRALGDADRRLMKYVRDPRHGTRNIAAAAEVGFDDADTTAGKSAAQILTTASRKMIEHHDLARAGAHQVVDDVRSNEAAAAGDQRSCNRHANLVNATRRPEDRNDSSAASSRWTTRWPEAASVSGRRHSAIASANSRTTRVSASVRSSFGACMSPVRYETRICRRVCSSGTSKSTPLSYTSTFSLGSMSLYTSIRWLPPMSMCRIFTGASQLT